MVSDHEYIEDVIHLAGCRADELKVRLDKGSEWLRWHPDDNIERMKALTLYKQLNLAYLKLIIMLAVGNLEV